MTNWEVLLGEALSERGESFDDIEASTLSDDELVRIFDSGYGGVKGVPFTVWTANTVYFPICYDGAEWVGAVSRNPDGKPTEHQGGG